MRYTTRAVELPQHKIPHGYEPMKPDQAYEVFGSSHVVATLGDLLINVRKGLTDRIEGIRGHIATLKPSKEDEDRALMAICQMEALKQEAARKGRGFLLNEEYDRYAGFIEIAEQSPQIWADRIEIVGFRVQVVDALRTPGAFPDIEPTFPEDGLMGIPDYHYLSEAFAGPRFVLNKKDGGDQRQINMVLYRELVEAINQMKPIESNV